MEKTFETEVLTRLAVIESKLDDYQNIKEKAEVAYTTSAQNSTIVILTHFTLWNEYAIILVYEQI